MAASSIVSFSSPFKFHWTIPAISKVEKVSSLEYIIEGSPWKIEASKVTFNSKQYLSVSLHYTSQNGISHAAGAVIELLTFDNSAGGMKTVKISPRVFNDSSPCFGFTRYLEWDNLFDGQNKYVKEDAIKFRINIEACPNGENKSILKSESLGQFCECSGLAKFLLTLTNIENLLAVQSPDFMLRDQKWHLTVYKESNGQPCLGVRLKFKPDSSEVSCKVEMTVKLSSSEYGLASIERSASNICQRGRIEYIEIWPIISFDELVEPENGYVQNGSITLEVEVKADKPTFCSTATKRPRPSSERDSQTEAKMIRLECPICERDLDYQDTSSIRACGHVFCTPCITVAISRRKFCPIDVCGAKVPKVNGLYRIQLPISE